MEGAKSFQGRPEAARSSCRCAREPEIRAAQLISETLSAAAGRATFPVVRESSPGAGRGIFVGETERGSDAVPHVRRLAPFDDVFSLRVDATSAFLHSARPDAIEQAAGWFLEKELGAHWFMPGPLGGHIPSRQTLRLTAGESHARPAFVSRALGVGGAWAAANRLESRLDHGHSYNRIFTREDLVQHPEFAPVKNGARYIPAGESDYAWQPDLTSPATVAHAAAFINRAFAAEPARISFPLCENDSMRFDESSATIERVAPLRFFRDRPDYSPLVFRFTNEVAEAVRAKHPERWVTAYAYYWCENAPDFPVAPNVVPFLTADRSQWFEPAFAAEDCALIERWCHSGARLVGVYDYLEGAPYLVPRPVLHAISQSIPFEFAAGVRAYYGEGAPNWGLDGPKPWLAAQLLWNPQQSPAALLATYYREFWQEAAEPMRAFFDCAERAWQTQPRPGYWIKYYLDEHQSLLFPQKLRREMRDDLATADQLAKNELVRARLAFVRDAFAVSDAFVEFCETRNALENPNGSEVEVMQRLREYARRKDTFLKCWGVLRTAAPLAIQTEKLEMYLRNDPAGAARLRLSRTAAGRAQLAEEKLAPVEAGTAELLNDPTWRDVTIGRVDGSISFRWAGDGALNTWLGGGEPCEHRRVGWVPGEAGARAVRFTGVKQEILSQLRDHAMPGQTYVGRARVRARVSAGNATFLIVTFFDEKFQPFALGNLCRLPVGDTAGWQELAVVATAPSNARYVGIGIRAMNQVNDDFAEFSDLSLTSVPLGR